jgi:hypothetical protein
MSSKKLAWCGALTAAGLAVGCGGPGDNSGPPETQRYIVSSLTLPEPVRTTAVGFNLDEKVSTGVGTACDDMTPDYESANDPPETGVDNAFSALVPQLPRLFDRDCGTTPPTECLRQAFGEQILDGSLLLMIEVTGINSYNNDDDVTFQFYRASLPGCVDTDPASCAPMVAGGSVAPGQMFDGELLGASVQGEIVGGRLRVRTPSLTIPITSGDMMLNLVFHNAELRANITADSLTNAVIGASLQVAEVVAAVEAFDPSLGGAVESLLGGIADLEPMAADPTTCAEVSAGLQIEAVDVNFPTM